MRGLVWGGLLVAGLASAQEEYALLFEPPPAATALRYLKPAAQAPASVDVITAEDIARYGYRSVAEAISSLPGFQATYDRAYAHLQVRGFSVPGDYNGRILVLIDGHRLNESLQDYAGLDSDFPLAMADIERIEVVRGPASSLYGSNAVLAVVQVFSKRPKATQLELEHRAASFGNYQGRFGLAAVAGEGSAYLSGALWRADGRRVLRFSELGRARELDSQDGRRLFGALEFGNLRFSGAFMERAKELPNATARFGDPGTLFHDRRAYADLSGRRALGDWQGNVRLFWDRYEFSDRLPQTETVNRDLWHAEQAGLELWGERFLGAHRVLIGGEYRASYLERMDNFDRPGETAHARNRSRNHVASAFVQDEWRLLPPLALVAGLRFDYYARIRDPTFNPRAALIWSPRPDTTVKILYGRAFRAPNAFESDYACCQGTWQANAKLRPEHVHTFEAVLERQWARFALRLAGFHYRLEDLIELRQAGGISRFVNSGSMRSSGFEAVGKAYWGLLSGQLSYSLANAEDAKGRRWPDSPRHLIKSRLALPLWGERLVFATEANYVGRRPTGLGGQSGDHLQLNFTLTFKPVAGLTVGFSLYNALDRPYRDPPFAPILPVEIPQDGRTFQARLEYRWP
ncbi:hypothetical protein JCM13664_14160 [Methylothermus subterraneus]